MRRRKELTYTLWHWFLSALGSWLLLRRGVRPRLRTLVKDPGHYIALRPAGGLERMHHVSSPILLQIWQPTKTQAVFGTKIKNSRNFTLPPYARLLFTDGKKSHYKRDTDLETCNERETCKEKRPRLKKVPVSQTCSSLSHCSPKLS